MRERVVEGGGNVPDGDHQHPGCEADARAKQKTERAP
jgi:hypothetical protein